MPTQFSRRMMLKLSATTLGGAILAACAAPSAAPASTQAESQPTAAPQTQGKKKVIFSSYTWSSFESVMNKILDGFSAANPDVEVERQLIPQDTDYWTKVQTQIASGTPPDVGISDYGHLVSYAKNGMVLDVTDYIKSSNFPIDKMIPAATEQYRWMKGEFDSGNPQGPYYGLPSDAQSQIFVYNKKRFDDAGVAYPTDDWTWDDVVDAAKKITNPDKNIWGMSMIPTYILFKGNFVQAAGGGTHSKDYTKSMLADPKTIEAYKWNWDLVYTHKVAPPPSGVQQENPFMSGQVAMYVEGVWWIPDFATGIKDFGWDVALLPKHPTTGKRSTTIESDGWWIYKGAKEQDASWKLLQYLAGTDGQKRFSDVNFVIPSAFPEIGTEWYSKNPPEHRMKVLDNIKTDSIKVDLSYFEYSTIQNTVGAIIDKAFADGTDIEKVMVDADKAMNDELKKAWDLFKA